MDEKDFFLFFFFFFCWKFPTELQRHVKFNCRKDLLVGIQVKGYEKRKAQHSRMMWNATVGKLYIVTFANVLCAGNKHRKQVINVFPCYRKLSQFWQQVHYFFFDSFRSIVWRCFFPIHERKCNRRKILIMYVIKGSFLLVLPWVISVFVGDIGCLLFIHFTCINRKFSFAFITQFRKFTYF